MSLRRHLPVTGKLAQGPVAGAQLPGQGPTLMTDLLRLPLRAMVEQGQMLLQLGCTQAQGYCIARPMPLQDFIGWARSWQPPAGWQKPSHAGAR